MPQSLSNHVFISYSRNDEQVMRRIVTFLRRRGIKVWVDNEGLIPGTPVWEAEIEKAIIGSYAVVVVLSPDSRASEWVGREISFAEHNRKRIFPVLVRGDSYSSIGIRLINIQFIDIREKETIGLKSLGAALSQYIAEREQADANRPPREKKVVVIGEFSRGKSTMINALMGREVLVSDFRPNTATHTVIKYGEPERFQVTYVKESGKAPFKKNSLDLRKDLEAVTSDPSMALLRGDKTSLAEQILKVEIWCNSEFLRTTNIALIDTPGLGSIFPAHRKITAELIPSSDAVLFLVQADPGPGEGDILFLRYIREYVDQIFFVLTKKDKARSADELEGMLEFARSTIESQAYLDIKHLYAVSALQALQGNYEHSGFSEFVPALKAFLKSSAR